MNIPNGIVQALIRNNPAHVAAVGSAYELRVMDGATAATTLLGIWQLPGQPLKTFAQHLADGFPMTRALLFASSFEMNAPVMISANRRGGGGPDANDLIVIEGNHRCLAMAIRKSWGMPLPACVGVFVML